MPQIHQLSLPPRFAVHCHDTSLRLAAQISIAATAPVDTVHRVHGANVARVWSAQGDRQRQNEQAKQRSPL